MFIQKTKSAIRYRLSSRAIVRPTGSGLVLETLGGEAVMRLSSDAMLRLVMALARSTTWSELEATLPEGPIRDRLRQFLERGVALGVLEQVPPTDDSVDPSPHHDHWEFHDAIFHARSRKRDGGAPLGATYRLRGRVAEEPPIRRTSFAGPVIRLPQSRAATPDAESSLSDVLASRRSSYDLSPITKEALGEFLYRTCRVTHVLPSGDIRKAYPSGGGLHSLEVYVIVAACDGVAVGLYYYDPNDHYLCHITSRQECIDRLVLDASQSTGGRIQIPPVLCVITARVLRTFWKYEGLGYRLLLLEVGALFQTMYLVATAMGLGCCALGTGYSDLFATAAGLDPRKEPSLGEVVIGARNGVASTERTSAERH